MKRPYVACRYVCGSLIAVTTVISALSTAVMANTSSASFNMKRQVINPTGILNVSDYTGQVTKGDFARILANASSYKENLSTSSISVFADVPNTHPDTIYIHIATSQGWVTGFPGGLFKPEEYIAYKDVAKVVLAMLGYLDEDFIGDLASSRISKFNYLELSREANRQPEEVLNQTDCMNIFYSLLETKKKGSSGIYGTVLGCELNSNGEISPITILDDEREGPILARKGLSIIQSVSFGSENANVLLNGTASALEVVKASQQNAGFAVVYYNAKSKTVWAYTIRGWDDDGLEDNNAYMLLKGEVKNIYYKSTDVMTPTFIHLEIDDDNSDGNFGEDGIDGDGYLTISLNSLGLQCLSSIYGGIGVGDEVIVIRNKSGSSYTAIDAIEY